MLRCLPPRFEAYKAVLQIAMNTDDLKFDQVAGILEVHNLEEADELSKDPKGIVFSAESKEEDQVKKIRIKYESHGQELQQNAQTVEKGEKQVMYLFSKN